MSEPYNTYPMRIDQDKQARTIRQVIATLKTVGQAKTYHDPWSHKNAAVRYSGNCVVCDHKVFEISEDGAHYADPDPRGALGEKSSCACLVASEYDMIGLDVPVCFDCHNTRETYERALTLARAQWFDRITSLTVIGRKWFDSINGNTYFSARALINGRTVATIDYEYGYGDQYLDSMMCKLERMGFLEFKHRTQTPAGCDPIQVRDETPWQWAQRNGVAFEYSASDVSRKRDL